MYTLYRKFSDKQPFLPAYQAFAALFKMPASKADHRKNDTPLCLVALDKRRDNGKPARLAYAI